MNNLTDVQLKDFFEGPLPSRIPPAGDKFQFAHDGSVSEINVLPIQVKPKRESDPLKFLRDIVSSDDYHTKLQGVYFDAENQCIVASDAHSLFVMKHKVKGKSKIINPKAVIKWDGTARTEEFVEIKDNYVNYRSVIPKYDDLTTIDIVPILSDLAGLDRANKFLSGYQARIFARIINKEVAIFFDPMKLYKLLLVFARLGFEKVNLCQSGNPDRCIMITAEGCEGLLMPFMSSEQCVYKTILTIE